MITLHVFGPAQGIPDPSSFVIKADILLQLSGQPFERKIADLRKAPKGKLPVIIDDGEVVPDSTFIRWHLEKKYNIDFDAGLTPEQRAQSWAIEKMGEDHLYWTSVYDRWMVEDHFRRGPAKFFDKVPALVRPLVLKMVMRSVRANLHGHGMSRHAEADIYRLATRDIDALAALIGDKPYLMGETICAADAFIGACIIMALAPTYPDSPLYQAAAKHANLVAYRRRMLERFFPAYV